ncbi:MAG: hypothetical protein FRX49_02429 [Trebouxia sp. A1-2]|nr:MAG: hypothetical protein FRX49_02429 [Trebouxia sp. A1-2]
MNRLSRLLQKGPAYYLELGKALLHLLFLLSAVHNLAHLICKLVQLKLQQGNDIYAGCKGTLKQSSSLTALGRALTSLTKALVPSSMTSVLMSVHSVWRHTYTPTLLENIHADGLLHFTNLELLLHQRRGIPDIFDHDKICLDSTHALCRSGLRLLMSKDDTLMVEGPPSISSSSKSSFMTSLASASTPLPPKTTTKRF